MSSTNVLKFANVPTDMIHVCNLIYLKVNDDAYDQVSPVQLHEMAPRTIGDVLVANENGQPLLTLKKLGLKLSFEECGGVYQILQGILQKVETMKQSYNIDELVEEVWKQVQPSSGLLPKVSFNVVQWPIGNEGLHLKVKGFNTSKKETILYRAILVRYNGDKFAGSGLELNKYEVGYSLF